MNGGPIFAEHAVSKNDTFLYVLGVHTGGRKNSNYGMRISQAKFAKIKEMMQFHFMPAALEETFFSYLAKNLCKIELNFEHTVTTAKMLEDSVYALRNNPEFKIILFKSKSLDGQHLLSKDAMQELSDSLKVMRKLEELRLDLYNINNIASNSIEVLMGGFGSLKDLSQCVIQLNGSTTLANQSLKDLSLGLQQLSKAHSISVYLYNLSNISDEGLKFIGAGFSKMNQVKSLKIDLQILKKCTEKGIRDMTKCLVSCTWLKKLQIDTVGFKISDITKKAIKDDFKWLETFKFV